MKAPTINPIDVTRPPIMLKSAIWIEMSIEKTLGESKQDVLLIKEAADCCQRGAERGHGKLHADRIDALLAAVA